MSKLFNKQKADIYQKFEDELKSNQSSANQSPIVIQKNGQSTKRTSIDNSPQLKDQPPQKKEGTFTKLSNTFKKAENYVEKKAQKFEEKVEKTAHKIEDKIEKKAQKVKEEIKVEEKKFVHHLEETANKVATEVEKAEKKVKDKFEQIDEAVHKAIHDQKEHINMWIAKKVDQALVTLLSGIEPKILSSCEQGVPFEWMKPPVNDALVNLWKDVSDIIRLEIQVKLVTPKEEEAQRPKPNLWHKIRSFIVYSLYPADLSQNNRIHRLSFIFVKTAQYTKSYSIQSFFFLLTFLAIHKTDEYQLVHFILEVKGIQFMSLGFIGAIMGYFEYFMLDEGPGQANLVVLNIVGILLEMVLLWSAFIMLRNSKSKHTFAASSLKIDPAIRGGRIRYFMMYEAFISLTSIALFLILYFVAPQISIAEMLYFCKTIYGLMSFPFVIFVVDFFIRIVTNAAPTGYNSMGRCVPMVDFLKVHYAELPFQRQKPIDVGEILP